MAEVAIKIDDLNGERDAETVEFHDLDGNRLAADFVASNRDALQAALDTCRETIAPFVAVAKPVENRTRRAPRARKTKNTTEPSEAARVRAWAKSEGLTVPERGPIPDELRDMWRDAQQN